MKPSSGSAPSLTLAELERRVYAAVPEAFLVEEHIVRRAVREDRGIAGLRTFVPHTQCAAVPVEVLAQVAPDGELGRPPPASDWALLLPRPDADDVAEADADQVLRATWRALFHAAIDRALMSEARAGRLDRQRYLTIVDRIGPLPMDEARAVLAEEGLTGAGSDEVRELVELAATWHELRVFAPELLGRWFPSLVARPEAQAALDELVPAAELLAATRPEGAPEPIAAAAPEPRDTPEDEPATPRSARSSLAAARRASDKKLDVAAAILAHKARRGAADEAARQESAALTSLGRRLGVIVPDGVSGSNESPNEWAAALAPLLPRARWGMTRVEARLLHDLEKACAGAERETWDIDLGRWLRSFGRGELRRKEVVRSEVQVVRSLLKASRRVALCRLDEAERRRLKRLLGTLADRAERRFRGGVGAILAEGLDHAGLAPQNLPEQVARDKIVAELCDKLLARGFIGFPELRDHIAKNQLKLHDLHGPKEWFRGDALLRLDAWYGEHLDGAYRKGEVYRRVLQRLSSLLFANRIGRFIVRYAIIPVGGAFFLVQGLEHMVGPLIGLFHEPKRLPNGQHASYFWSLPAFIATAVVLFAVLHSATVRRAAVATFRGIGRGLRFVFTELPRRFRHWPPIDRLVKTRAFYLFWHRLFRPARYALVPTLVVVLATGDPRMWLFVGAPLVVLFSIFLASKRGERFSEAFGDWLTTTWHYLEHELVPGFVAWVMALFKRLMELAEVMLYTVDQWLRFRRGDSRVGVVLKGFFGVFWGLFAYVFRLMVNLVAEPQVNPIKHFPVVTVSHKLTIPLTIAIAHELKPHIGVGAANVVGGLAQLIIPGVCGFLVWEFKENWRLYRANRQPILKPVVVGGHGEPVYRLLRLGFHSGTVPRIFRKLRKAEKRGNALEIRKQIEELHHVEEAMERFVERELKRLLELSGRFPEAARLHVEGVRLTPFRIAIDVGCAPLGEPLQLAFEEQAGFLVAGLAKKGFVATLDALRKDAFDTALAGLYMLAGVDLVREHIEALLPVSPGGTRYDIGERGLVVWPEGFRAEILYRLRTRDPVILPQVTGEPGLVAPALSAADLHFKRRPLAWTRWIHAWPEPTPVEAPAAAASSPERAPT